MPGLQAAEPGVRPTADCAHQKDHLNKYHGKRGQIYLWRSTIGLKTIYPLFEKSMTPPPLMLKALTQGYNYE